MKDLRLLEKMTKQEIAEWGKDNPHRIEYAYGAVCKVDNDMPIILRVRDFWMPLQRAKQIHEWLGKAIAQCEKKKRL